MEIRKATIKDAEDIHQLIKYYAERRKMLFRTLEEIYQKIREFFVCYDEKEGKILGCCGLYIHWKDLAEIRSLAVLPEHRGKGIGRKLVEHAIHEAKELGIKKVFALTMEPEFFEKMNFKKIDKSLLPYKVWSDCLKCPIYEECNEVPLLYTIY